jgi:PPOX class probable F420-dependent enzyme
MTTNPLDILKGHQYMALTTTRKNGAAVTTPVWFAIKDGMIYLYTEDGSGKIKRIRHTPTVQIAPCTVNGRILGESFTGQARIINETEYAPVQAVFNAKYGFMIRVFGLLGRLRKSKKRIFLEITPMTA